MAPHALQNGSPASERSTMAQDWTSFDEISTAGHDTDVLGYQSLLRRSDPDELQDLICVGFGPASLAIAVALHDALENRRNYQSMDTDYPNPKVVFLEKQPHFAWHAGMLLPGAKMQITFIKDLATLRNPRSDFTFLNYLHKKDRLVEFTNLSTFLPQRIEFEDYLKWCAEWFQEITEYSQEVLDVVPKTAHGGADVVDSFAVTTRNTATGEIVTRHGRHVVIAAGGKPQVPKLFPQSHPCVIHSSQYAHRVSQILPDPSRKYRVAIVGSGQSAAEVFESLHVHYPNSEITLLIKGAALKPSDDSPFVNEVFNPARTDSTFNLPPALRAEAIADDRNTNYGVVRLELLERIYESLYLQRIKYRTEDEWPWRILNHRVVTGVDVSPTKGGKPVRLAVQNNSNAHASSTESLDVDLLVLATGYTRDAHEDMLSSARHLMPHGGMDGEKWEVGRDYRVKFAEGAVAGDAGVWLQGCNQGTHGLADTLLSVLAVRGGEIVDSIFGLH